MRMISLIGTFFGVLFVLLFAVAVTSNGALKGPDAFALRWTVLSLAVALSGLATWLRWRMSQPQRKTANREASIAVLKTVLAARGGPGQPSAVDGKPTEVSLRQSSAHSPPAAAAEVAAASKHAIVFRQHFPPRPGKSTLSFFGGAPIAESGFRWPRPPRDQAQSKPFSFLLQIDCAAVPPEGRRGLLPDRGVLYFFHDLTWAQPDAFCVVYADAKNIDRWKEVHPPDDLGPAYGDQAVHRWKWTQSAADCPRLLPKWTFDPVVIDVPAPRRDQEEDADAPALWPGEKTTAEALLASQGEDVPGNWFTVRDFTSDDGRLRRPFANYPHDWRAIQICSGLLAEKLRHTHGLMGTGAALRDRTDAERDALRVQIRDEALAWFSRAAADPPFAAVPQAESDRFWSWLEACPWLVRFVIKEAVTLSIEASLVESQEAAARIPADVARRVHSRHALAVQSERGLFASTPDRMLAPPVDVQGNQWDRAKTHLLLLELSSNEALGHDFGEGVYQFWITPADLRARRFDKVVLTADAY
jgi:hypothetical protein